MRTKLVVAVAGLALSLGVTAVSVSAHHAFAAEFDANKPLTLQGHRHEDGMDQPPCLGPHGREGAGRQG